MDRRDHRAQMGRLRSAFKDLKAFRVHLRRVHKGLRGNRSSGLREWLVFKVPLASKVHKDRRSSDPRDLEGRKALPAMAFKAHRVHRLQDPKAHRVQ